EREEFAAFFPQIVRDLTEDGLGHPEVGDAVARLKQVLEYNAPGGKCNRGLTVVAAFRRLAGPAQQDPESLRCALAVGWCIELFQAFFLVADDIMDASLTRRGQLCWYKKEGIGLDAINDAFLLESMVYRLLRRYCGQQPYYLHLLELFLQVSPAPQPLPDFLGLWTSSLLPFPRAQALGLNLVPWHRYKAIVKYKTAFYSFYLPVAAAMYMAGINGKEEHENAKAILLEMGEFFQIQENYGCKEPEKVARVKELYNALGMEAAFREYEESSYQRLQELIGKHAQRLPREIFLDLAQKIYKRQNSCSDFSLDDSPVSVYCKGFAREESQSPDKQLNTIPTAAPARRPPPACAPSPPAAAAGPERSQSRAAAGASEAGRAQGRPRPPGSRQREVTTFKELRSRSAALPLLPFFSCLPQAQLGDSRLNPDVGYLLLHTLCPALYALVEDGLKPFQKDVITGQRKNSPWSVVEASVKTGEGPNTRSLHSLCWHVAGLAPLSSTRQKFHAFILGLLNIKQLELWISHLQKSPGVISVLYSPTAF
ncbi:FPPS synthase, partial [Erythrocercus mccallii]|nr:FPPS synthase [Erythrocercus mccallii]